MSDEVTLLPPNATATERALARVVGRTTALAVGTKYRALWDPNGNQSSITINGIKFSSFYQGIDRNNYIVDIQESESNSVEYAEKIGLGGESQKKLTIRYEIGITYSALSIIVNNLSAIAEEIKAEVVNDGVVSIDNGLYKLSGGTGCPYDTLPWLAWSLHVDEWDSNWTEQQKRDVIATSVAVHKTKGTIGALKRALSALGYEVTVDEDTGEVYTFRLEFNLNQTGAIGTGTFAAARRVALANKNARSKLLAIRSSLTETAGVYGAVVCHRAQTVTVNAGTYDPVPPVITDQPDSVTQALGSTVTLSVTATSSYPISYQWYFNDVEIINATSDTYDFTLSSENEGAYYVVVSNDFGSTTSNSANVIISGVVSQFSSLTGGRDICQASNGNFYVVSDSGVYEVLPDGTYSLISATAVGNGICQKSDGYLYVCGSVTWKLDTSGNTTQYSERGGNKICEGYNGLLYTTGFNNYASTIWSINDDGTYQVFSSVGYYPYTSFEGICYDGTNFYLKNANNNLTAVISNSGSIITSNLVQVDGYSILSSSDGYIYVLSYSDMHGTPMNKVSKTGIVTAFSNAMGHGFCEANDGNFYVVNFSIGIFKVTH